MEQKLSDRIVVDPEIMVGKPIIKGTRIPVDLIIRQLAQSIKVKDILADYPQLSEEDVKAALLYSAEVISGETILPF